MAKSTRQSEEVVLGKKFAGEKFSTVRSAEDIAADQEYQKQFDHENAVPISVYFNIRGHLDPVLQKMMQAHTKVRRATLEAFDNEFKSFFSSEPQKETEKPSAEAPAVADEQTAKEV